MKAEIWIADWTFYVKAKKKDEPPSELVIKDVITKRIPPEHVLNDGSSYKAAVRGLSDKDLDKLEEENGYKKFKIKYNRKIGETNE